MHCVFDELKSYIEFSSTVYHFIRPFCYIELVYSLMFYHLKDSFCKLFKSSNLVQCFKTTKF